MLEALQRQTRSSRRCSGKLVTRLQYRHLGRNKKVAPASRPTAAMAAATTETARPHQKTTGNAGRIACSHLTITSGASDDGSRGGSSRSTRCRTGSSCSTCTSSSNSSTSISSSIVRRHRTKSHSDIVLLPSCGLHGATQGRLGALLRPCRKWHLIEKTI